MKKIGFQGELGAYSEQAIFRYFGKDVEAVPLYSFEEVFNALGKDEIELGVVPIENFLAGSIVQTYDLLLEHNFYIVGEIFLGIHHNLIANKESNLNDIKEVYSHPQALAQCIDFIKEHKLVAKASYDTAGAVKEIKEENSLDKAAIASKITAEIYDMKILEENIESVKNNVTRFIIISKQELIEKKSDEEYLTSIIFSTADIPAALYKCLGGFATNKVNLTKLESRPVKGKIGDYFFYVDLEFHKEDESFRNALKELEFFSSSVKILGSYPKGKKE